LGGELLKAWNLPDRLIEAVSCHHCPQKAISHPEETAVVNLADAIAYSLKSGSSGETFVPLLEPASWETIGLPESLYLPMIKDKIEQQVEDVISVFLQPA
jgi:HD-like signal output (HDOD) protein